jgi:hypothetical protein
VDRIARVQTIAAVVLGIVLIAIPLYLWRRPRSEAPPVTSDTDAGAHMTASADGGAAPPASAAPAPSTPQVTLSDPKVMECHDPGSKRTRPEDCDHLAAVEKALAAAISSAGACVPDSAGGGTLVYVADASFARKRKPIDVFVPRDGRDLRNPRATATAVKECTAAVKKGMAGVALDGVPHAHQRYKTAITATYAGRTTP